MERPIMVWGFGIIMVSSHITVVRSKFLAETVWPGFNRRWYTNVYQYVCKAKDFYSSKEAWSYRIFDLTAREIYEAQGFPILTVGKINSGDVVKVSSMPDGDYTLQLYHTWRGRFFHEEKLSGKNGSIEFLIPVLKIEDSHARYVGQDVAFVLKPAK